ncbi:hypothetical protein [Synechococcus sp. LTW-R]|uniref:hypothetical protein n=1 Tax=Synechococcus sp. LTW-R TaxID=2751170 RepID=UPI001623BA86|nr:hypothetical protein [Synechococcus sp. LTW-R]QNG29576.1 hypothetical protein H0O22_12920 [Synechococcus sp. LTW-R]
MVITSILATVVSYQVLAPLFGPEAWVLNNDHLMPFDHIRLILSGKGFGLRDITWARIPSLFPDYFLAFVSGIFSGNWIEQFSFYWHVQIFFCVSAFLFLAQFSCGVAGLYLSAGVYSFLVWFFPGYAEIIFYSGVPIYHGGNFVNVALLIFLVSCLLSGECRGFRGIGIYVLFAYSLVASFSSRLFFVQLIAPLWVLFLINIRIGNVSAYSVDWRRLWTSKVARFLGLISIASISGLVSYVLVIHQCTDVGISAHFDVFVAHFRRMGERGLLVFCLLSYLPLILAWCGPGRVFPLGRSVNTLNGRKREIFIYSLIAISSLFTVFVFYISAVDSWSGYGRYLITPAYFLPVAAVLAVRTLSRYWPRIVIAFGEYLPGSAYLSCQDLKIFLSFYPLIISLLSLCAVFVFTFFDSAVSSAILIRKSHRAPIQWLVKVLRSNNLLGELGYVADPPFESRALHALSNMKIRALSVSTDGNPLMFPHSRTEYLSRWARSNRALYPMSGDVLPPKWVLARQSNTRRLFERFGHPIRTFDCNGNACVYEFDQARVVENGATYFQTIRFDVYKCKSDTFKGIIISKLHPFYRQIRGRLSFVFQG